jgi:hypothetical protein
MGDLAPVLAALFAALAVWVTVRIVNRRGRWPKYAAVAMLVATAYLLSIGPACWLTSWLNCGTKLVPIVYRPITLFFVGSDNRNSAAGTAVRWYSEVGAAPGWGWWRASVGFIGRSKLQRDWKQSDGWDWTNKSWSYNPSYPPN